MDRTVNGNFIRNGNYITKILKSGVPIFDNPVTLFNGNTPSIIVPNALSNANVKMIGGMSRKCRNLCSIDTSKSGSYRASGVAIENGIQITRTNTSNPSYFYCAVNLIFKPNETYKISFVPTGNYSRYLLYYATADGTGDENWPGVGRCNSLSVSNGTFVTPSDNFKSLMFVWYMSSGEIGDTTNITNLQIEEGSTATDFEPYTSNLISAPITSIESKGADTTLLDTLTIPQAVINLCPNYGKGVNTVSNRILVTDNEVHYDERTATTKVGKYWYKQEVRSVALESLNHWRIVSSSGSRTIFGDDGDISIKYPGASELANLLTAKYSTVSYNKTWVNGNICASGWDGIRIITENDVSLETFITRITNQILIYELATPKWYCLDDTMPSLFEKLLVESGGTIALRYTDDDKYIVAVPSQMEYYNKY